MVNTLIPLTRFDEVLDSFFTPGRTQRLVSNGESGHRVPYADILEGEKHFLIRLDLPGVKREDLNISLEDQSLDIEARRELSTPEGYQPRRKELPTKQTFKRSFKLGSEIQLESIAAKLEEGVLTITLPKSDKAMPRQINVQ